MPVVPISAAKNEGVDELVRHAIHMAKYQENVRADRISVMRMIMAVQYTDVYMRSAI